MIANRIVSRIRLRKTMKRELEHSPKRRTPVRNHQSYIKKKSERPVRWLHSGMATVSPFPILLMIVVMLFAGGLASSACNAASNPPEVRVGTELDFPPYAFVDESGGPAGFSIELIKAVSDVMGLSIKISTGSWDTVWNALVAGQFDVLPIVAKMPERQRLVDFSLPHTETYDSFFVREEDPPIKNIAAAQGMGIVVMRSDAAHHELLERNFKGNLVLVDTIPEGLLLILSGKHNAFLCSKLIGTLLIKKHGLRGITPGPPIPDYKRVFSFAVKKGYTQLLEKLNQGLLIVKTNGDYDRIYDKWLTADDPWRRMRKYIMPTVIVVIAVLLFAGLWLATLKRIIRKRNIEITKRKRTEEALQESESRYRELFNNISSGVAIYEVRENGADFVFKDFNKAGERIDGDKREDLIGKSLLEVRPGIKEFGILDAFKKVWETGIPAHFPVAHYKDARLSQWYENFVYKLPSGEIVAVFDNVTDQKRVEETRDKLIADLQKTLSEVKTLRGFLPICSYCKKIRDDKGYWNQIESYIHDHSEAEFSHSICQECAKKHYPDMDIYDD